MSIFANTTVRESYGWAPDVLSDVKLQMYNEEDTIMESGLMSLAEAENDWRDIIDEMVCKEYAVLESTGEEMIYEAADIKVFFNKVIEWFKKLWSKIAGLFQKFLTAISGKVSSDQKFLDKYEGKIKTGYNLIPSGGFAFKGNEFDHIDDIEYGSIDALAAVAAKMEGIDDIFDSVQTTGTKKDIQAMKKTIEKFKNGRDKLNDSIRGLSLKGKGKISANEFSKTCKDYLYGKQYTQFTGKGKQPSASDIISEIKSGKFAREQCKINYNKLKSDINTAIATVNNISKNVIGMNSEDELKGLKMQCGNLACDTFRFIGQVYQTINSVQLSAMNARHSQFRSIAAKCVQYADKEVGTVNSSYMMDTEDFESLMEI